MTPSTFVLAYSIAGRNLLRKRLRVTHWDGFGKVTTADFARILPPAEKADTGCHVVHSATVAGELKPVQHQGRYLVYTLQSYPRHLTRFEGTFEEFLQGLSAKARSTLGRKVRKFARESPGGAIDWREYRSAEEMDNFLTLAIPLAAQTYQAQLFDGALPDTPEFRKEAIAAAGAGTARGFLLFLGEQAVAYLYTPITENRYLYAYLGYDQGHAHLSPGTVLQYLVHERLFADPAVEYFDFTEGDGPHKALFANESAHCATLLCLPDTVGNRLLVGSHRLWNKVITAGKACAQRLNLLPRLRRLLRQTKP